MTDLFDDEDLKRAQAVVTHLTSHASSGLPAAANLAIVALLEATHTRSRTQPRTSAGARQRNSNSFGKRLVQPGGAAIQGRSSQQA